MATSELCTIPSRREWPGFQWVSSAANHVRALLRYELSGTLPVNPLQWRMITANIDEQTSVMATVYGNDIAVEYARTHTEQDYPAGAILAVVTWTQREDPRWFGAEIPGRATSVEFVRVTATADGRRGLSYEKYEGTPLRLVPAQNPADVDARTKFVLSQRAAVLP